MSKRADSRICFTDICIPLYWYSRNGSSSSIADVAYGDNPSEMALAYMAMLGNEERVLKKIWAESRMKLEKQVSWP